MKSGIPLIKLHYTVPSRYVKDLDRYLTRFSIPKSRRDTKIPLGREGLKYVSTFQNRYYTEVMPLVRGTAYWNNPDKPIYGANIEYRIITYNTKQKRQPEMVIAFGLNKGLLRDPNYAENIIPLIRRTDENARDNLMLQRARNFEDDLTKSRLVKENLQTHRLF